MGRNLFWPTLYKYFSLFADEEQKGKTLTWRANVFSMPVWRLNRARSGIERRKSATFAANFVETRADVSRRQKRKWFLSIPSRSRGSFPIVSNVRTYVSITSKHNGVAALFPPWVHVHEIVFRRYITYLWIPYLLTGCFPQKPYRFLVNTINLARKNFLDAFPRHRHGWGEWDGRSESRRRQTVATADSRLWRLIMRCMYHVHKCNKYISLESWTVEDTYGCCNKNILKN